MIVLGIDPGLEGAVAALADNGSFFAWCPMPVARGKRDEINVVWLRDWLVSRNADVALVAIEEPQPSPGRTSVAAAKAIGMGFGKLLALCELFDVPHERVRPQTWQRAVLGAVKPGRSKQAAQEYCRRRWPNVELITGKRNTPHDGLADALVIAEWGRRLIVGADTEGGAA